MSKSDEKSLCVTAPITNEIKNYKDFFFIVNDKHIFIMLFDKSDKLRLHELHLDLICVK